MGPLARGRVMRLVVAFVLAASGVASGYAEEGEKGTIAGAGWVSCGEYAQKYQADPQNTEDYFYAWAQGYMSGLNQALWQKKNLRGWPIARQKQHIRAYCDKRPLANVVAAVQDVFDNLPAR
ncbi:hypothetical protein ASD83_15605 [Devosia sp. Root685]|nr:hypothetical protein ASD83_15605 [Devosia sp. Root685]